MKSLSLAILTLLLLTSLFGVVPISTANYSPAPPCVFVISPKNNYVYDNNSLQLKIWIDTFFDVGNGSRQAFYSLDRQANVSIPIEFDRTSQLHSVATGSVNLTGLSIGIHCIDVFALYYSGVDKESLIFYVFDRNFLIITISITILSLATVMFLFRKKLFHYSKKQTPNLRD
jgi:hypothetical protein